MKKSKADFDEEEAKKYFHRLLDLWNSFRFHKKSIDMLTLFVGSNHAINKFGGFEASLKKLLEITEEHKNENAVIETFFNLLEVDIL